MDILELNNELSQAFKDFKAGKITAEQAKGLVDIGSAITNNTRLILDAAKVAQNPNIASLVVGSERAKELISNDLFEEKTAFAQKLGYPNLGEAFAKMGRWEFERQFNEHNG